MTDSYNYDINKYLYYYYMKNNNSFLSDLEKVRFFPHADNLNKIIVNKVGLYSLSKSEEDNCLRNILENEIEEDMDNIVVTDATGGIGGATIIFSRYVKKVHVYEKEKSQFDCLLSNLSAHSFCENVCSYHLDYLENIDQQTQDIVFVDPPWGGPGYKQKKGITLLLNEKKMSDIVNLLIGFTKYVIIKVPFNFNFNQFNNDVITKKISLFKVKNYFIIFVNIKNIKSTKPNK